MATKTKLYRYKSEISEEEFRHSNVLSFTDDLGRPAILIKNAVNKTVMVQGKTDNIEFHLNSVISKGDADYCFHVICCTKNDAYSKEQFDIAFKYLFDKISCPQRDNELSSLITSLESLFKVSKETDLSNLRLGVFGELLFIDQIYQHGYHEILDKYHSNFFSKHDIEISSGKRVEIKTTKSAPRIHHFKHDQLVRNDISVFIGSLVLEESEEGLSLFDLFGKIESYLSSPDQILSFGQLKSFCRINSEDHGPSFAYERAISLIKIFDAHQLPHLEIGDPLGITNIAYDVDCSTTEGMPFEAFISAIK